MESVIPFSYKTYPLGKTIPLASPAVPSNYLKNSTLSINIPSSEEISILGGLF
jgi:hypothetical protein